MTYEDHRGLTNVFDHRFLWHAHVVVGMNGIGLRVIYPSSQEHAKLVVAKAFGIELLLLLPQFDKKNMRKN